MMILLFLLLAESKVALPAKVQFAHYLIEYQDHFYILDGFQQALFKINAKGITNAYIARGMGPGEYTQISNTVVNDQGVFILDNKQRKFISLDHDFVFREQAFIPAGGLAFGFDVTDQFIFCYFLNGAEDGMMIHQFDRKFNLIRRFGSGFEALDLKARDPRQLRFAYTQGSLWVVQQKLYVLHHFLYRIDVFDMAGNLLEIIPIPGASVEDLFNTNKQSFEVMAHHFVNDGADYLYFHLGNRYPNAEVYIPVNRQFQLNTNTHELRMRNLEHVLRFPIANGKMVDVVEEEETCILRIFDNPFSTQVTADPKH